MNNLTSDNMATDHSKQGRTPYAKPELTVWNSQELTQGADNIAHESQNGYYS